MTTPHEPYTERHLALVREAEGADGHTYCPPLDAPMSVQQRYRARDLRANPLTHTEAVNAYRAIWTDEDGHEVDVFGDRLDEVETRNVGRALTIFVVLMAGFIAFVYGVSWLAGLIFNGV